MPSSSVSTSDFLKGLVTPIRAVGVIFSSSKLLAWSAFPILATCLVLALFFYALMAGLWTLIHTHFTGYFASFQSTFMVVVGAVTAVIFVYATIQSLALLTSLIASPFNDFLAESTERELGVRDVPPFGFRRAWRVLLVDVRKTALSFTASLVLALLLLVPVVGIVSYLGIAFLNTFTFITYPQSRREMGVRDSITWIRRHLSLSLGFGITSATLFAIPVLNLFALPVMVVGGTLLFIEQNRD